MFPQFFAHGGEAGCHTVDGEHPDGSAAGKLPVFMEKNGIHAGPHAFHTPAGSAAAHKISDKIFFHISLPE